MLQVEIDGKKVVLSEEIAREFEALPNTPFREWTEEMDAVLLEFWPRKNKGAVAKKLGIPRSTCEGRFNYLLGRNEMVK